MPQSRGGGRRVDWSEGPGNLGPQGSASVLEMSTTTASTIRPGFEVQTTLEPGEDISTISNPSSGGAYTSLYGGAVILAAGD